MELFWVNAIVHTRCGYTGLIAWSDGCISMKQAMEGIQWLKDNYKVFSAWIDKTDDSGKTMVFHECYVDDFGNVNYK